MSQKKEYGWGSNFYKLKGGVLISGELWNDTESYFQAMKFRGPNASSRSIEYSNLIKLADSSMKVKALGSQRKLTRYFTKLVLNKKED